LNCKRGISHYIFRSWKPQAEIHLIGSVKHTTWSIMLIQAPQLLFTLCPLKESKNVKISLYSRLPNLFVVRAASDSMKFST